MSKALSENQVEHWNSLYEEYLADDQQLAYFKELDEKRLVVQREMLKFLDDYLAGRISTREFKATFDLKTRKAWSVFGLKGMSGAMFLNNLVNHLPDENALTNELHSALALPKDIEDGQVRMQAFLRFLEVAISTRQVTKRQIQPARIPFFISAWWHQQATEEWPVFYPRVRQALEIEGLYMPSQDPIKDYFTFRECYLSLATALHLNSRELEYLFTWYNQRYTGSNLIGQRIANAFEGDNPELIQLENQGGEAIEIKEDTQAIAPITSNASSVSLPQEQEDEQPNNGHLHIQWLLAKIGHKLGCNVWIAANDQNKVWKSERLGDLSLKALPALGMESEPQQIIGLIDVLWLKGTNAVVAAFEVEHTTSIYSGILRMSDLVVLSPNINFPLYIVTPEVRLDFVLIKYGESFPAQHSRRWDYIIDVVFFLRRSCLKKLNISSDGLQAQRLSIN
jgi:hypothetical protein